MKVENIEAIGIDDNGSLWIQPKHSTFPMIYREAREVHWDREQRRLYAPKPNEWTYVDWFLHIVSTAREASVQLRLTPETKWVGIDTDLRNRLEAK
jgi:hypothetical protein